MNNNKEQKEEVTNKSTIPKKRKVTNGPIRSKARTKEKLINSVGKVLKQEGYTGLTITNIVKTSGVHQRLIYDYFGTVDNLIKMYLLEKDFWNSEEGSELKDVIPNSTVNKNLLLSFLQDQFNFSHQSKELQKIILWEISLKNRTTRKLGNDREEQINKIFQSADFFFEQSDFDIKAIMALLMGGIYHLNLHAGTKNTTFCGLDLNTGGDRERINAAIKLIVGLCYNMATKELQSEHKI